MHRTRGPRRHGTEKGHDQLSCEAQGRAWDNPLREQEDSLRAGQGSEEGSLMLDTNVHWREAGGGSGGGGGHLLSWLRHSLSRYA